MGHGKIIGIDLGTTNSCVAVVEGGKPIVIPNSEGYRTTPSVVAFGPDGEKMVGHVAKRQAVTNPERTVHSVKRLMGTQLRVHLGHQSYSPEQLSALILQRMKKQAQDYLGQKVTRAIITVPAYFDDAERLATRDAGEIAGLEVVRIINEPTASALSYGLARQNQEGRIVVFDFGGGTFDVTILEMDEQVLRVRATNGNNRLGGDDIDRRVAGWIAGKFREATGLDVSGDRPAWQRVLEAAEEAKIELSGQSTSDIDLPFLIYDKDAPLHFRDTISISQFNALNDDLIKAVCHPVQRALFDAKLRIDQIDHIILVGGSTRIPAVRKFIRELFGKEPVNSVNPDEAVAMGAAIQGGIMNGEIEEMLLLDVVPISMSIERADGKVDCIFPRNTAIPTTAQVRLTTSINCQKHLDVHVVQGEDERASNNKSMARITVSGLPPTPARGTEVALSFSIDSNGILSCEARNALTGAMHKVSIDRVHGLTREQLELLARASALEAEKEQRDEDRTAASINAQSCLLDGERTLVKHKGAIEEVQQERIKQLMFRLRDAVVNGEPDDIRKLTDELASAIAECVRAVRLKRPQPAG